MSRVKYVHILFVNKKLYFPKIQIKRFQEIVFGNVSLHFGFTKSIEEYDNPVVICTIESDEINLHPFGS